MDTVRQDASDRSPAARAPRNGGASRRFLDYLSALPLAAAAIASAWILAEPFGGVRHFVPLALIAFGALVFGTAPALLATALTVLGSGLLLEPRWQILVADRTGVRQLVGFTLVAILASAIGGAQRRSRLRLALSAREARAQAEKDRRNAEILRVAHDAIFVWSPERGIESWNRGAEELYGHGAEAAVGRSPHELLGTRFPVPFAQIEAELARAGRWEGELRQKARDGREVVVSSKMQVLDRREGSLQVLVSNRDITARKLAEAELARAQQLLTALSESTPDNLFVKDREGRLIFANPAMLRIVGKPAGQVLGHTAAVWCDDPAQAAAIEANDREVMQTGESRTVEEALTTADGVRTFLGTKTPLRDATGRVTGLVGTSQDITDRIRAEQEQARLAEIIRDSDDAILSESLDGTVVTWNRGAEQMFGYRAAEIVGRPVTVLYPAEKSGEDGQVLHRVLAGERIDHFETERVCKSGERLAVSVTLSPLRGRGGKLVGASKIIRDMTAQKRAEQALRASEQRAWEQNAELEAIFASMVDGLVVCGPAGEVRRINPRARAILGFHFGRGLPAERVARSRMQGPDGHPVGVEQTPVWRALQGETVPRMDFLVHAEDGHGVWIRASGAPIRGPDGRPVGAVTTFSDITKQKRAEDRLEDARKRLEVILAQLPVGVLIADDRGRVLDVNERGRAIWGGEGPVRCLGGDVGCRAFSPVDHRPLAPDEWALARAVRRGETVMGELVEIERADGSRGTILNSATPFRDASGAISGAVAVVLDITERQRADEALREANDKLREANERLRIADRRKNEFLAMLSHELRNPLAPVCNAVYLLGRADPSGPQASRAREVIDRQVRHLTRLVDDLLDLTRITRGKVHLHLAPVDLGALARRAAEDHRDAFVGAGIQLAVEGEDEPLWVNGDATRLSQVIGNLLGNAAKFTPRGGRVVLSAKVEEAGAVLRVRDSGVGIAPELASELFEPFVQAAQSLDRSKGGLGLGLSLVKSLTELHGGTVAVHSDGPGRGAEFAIRLPLAEPAHAREAPRAAMANGAPGGG